MPLETFQGLRIASLLARAQRMIGEDAVVLSVKRVASRHAAGFELLAADPDTADEWRKASDAAPTRGVGSHEGPARNRPLPDGKPVIVALVGPTGSGKTTTIAKLANHPAAFGSAAVGLLSLDTYRIGALEQSRIYAELSRTPLEVVHETTDIRRALRRLRDRDVLLVDTAGRGPGRQPDAAGTRAHLAALNPYEIHLTLPAGLQPRRARQIIEEYLSFGVTHLIPTKIDECPDDETPFRLAAEYSLPVLWITNGQEVPNDLRTVSAQEPSGLQTTPSPIEERVLETA
jgi:flagellar biosynthesis protein FlhF